jgi:transcriptional regulator with XRE-family HTH domain
MTLDDSVKVCGGKAVQIARVFQGYDAREVAANLGISHTHYSNIEHGRWSMKNLQRFRACARIISLPEEYLESLALELDDDEPDRESIDSYQRINDHRIGDRVFEYARADSLRIIRNLLGVSQQEIARAKIVSNVSLSLTENMWRVGTENFFHKVCTYLDVKIEDLNIASYHTKELKPHQVEIQKEAFFKLHQRWRQYN